MVAHGGDDQLQSTRVPLLLGLGILTHSLGEVVFAYYVIAFDRPPPMPSLATIGFLGQYPFLLLARGQVVLPLGPGECRVPGVRQGPGRAELSPSGC